MKYKYFIKDEALQTSDDDYFGHIDIAENIRKMIDNTDAPFNIAIIGKWGMGKSSLINIVKKQLEGNSDKYLVQEINAWKYQKEDFGRAFLKQLLQLVSEETITTQQQFDKILGKYLEEPRKPNKSNRKEKLSFKKMLKRAKDIFDAKKDYMRVGIVFFLLSFLAVFLYKTIVLQTIPFGESFLMLLRASFVCYCKNVVVVLVVPLIVWYGKIYMDQMVAHQNVQMGIAMPLESRDDYEIYLRAALKKNKDKKIITVIDDLDRLDISKIVDALDALKVFMDLENCIFIVPFDDAILKKAINEKRIEKLNSTESVIDSELVLDKLFQYKIYIPELVKINIKEYAVQLFQNSCTDFVHEYMNGNMDIASRIVSNIIIHRNVVTPRQVKKLLNTFINNVMVAYNRQKRGDLQPDFITGLNGIQFLAKISVLQADFNEFYDLLFVDMNVMEELLEIYRSKTDQIPECLSNYFEESDKNQEIRLKTKYRALVNYLIHTEKYNKVEVMASYVYMAQDKISVLTGDKTQQEFMEDALSKNIQSVHDKLNRLPILAEKLCQFLTLSDDDDEIMIICNVSVNIFDVVEEEYKGEIISAIQNRLGNCIEYIEDTGVSWLDFDNYFAIKKLSDEPDIYDKALIEYMADAMNQDNVVSIFASILKHRQELSSNTNSELKECLQVFVDEKEYSYSEIDTMCTDMDDDSISEYFNSKMFVHIANDILEQNEFDKTEVCNSFLHYFPIYVHADNILDYSELLLNMATNVKAQKLLFDVLSIGKLHRTIPTDIGMKMVIEITANEVENSTEYAYKLLSILPYKIEEDDVPNNIDNFINSSNLSSDLLISVIENYVSYGNDMELLKDTIEDLSILATKEETKINAICVLSKYYTDAQRKYLIDLITNKSKYEAKKDYAHEKLLIRRLHRESSFSEEIVKLVSNNLITWQKTSGNNLLYLNFVIFVVEEVAEELPLETIDKIAKDFLDRYNAFPAEIINAINNIGNYISKNVCVDAAKIFKGVSELGMVDSVARFYYVNTNVFTEDNGNLSDLLQFVETNWNNLTDKVSAMKALAVCYKTINAKSVSNISKCIVNDVTILSDAAKYMCKFYNNINMDKLSNLVIDLVRESDIDTMINLLFSTETSRSLKDVIKYIVENVETFTTSDLEIIIAIMNYRKLKNKDWWLAVYSAFLEDNTNIEQNEMILEQINEKNDYRELGADGVTGILLKIYGNTASDILKKKVVNTVKHIGKVRKFKGLLGEDGKKEFDVLGKK